CVGGGVVCCPAVWAEAAAPVKSTRADANRTRVMRWSPVVKKRYRTLSLLPRILRVEPLDDFRGQIQSRMHGGRAGITDAEDRPQVHFAAHRLEDRQELLLKVLQELLVERVSLRLPVLLRKLRRPLLLVELAVLGRKRGRCQHAALTLDLLLERLELLALGAE